MVKRNMKKFLSVLCMCICLFGLTACSDTKPVSPEDSADVLERSSVIVNYILSDKPEVYQSISYQTGMEITGVNTFAEKGADFTEYLFTNLIGFPIEGNGFITGIDSWNKAVEEFGPLVNVGESNVTYGQKGDTLIVDMDVQLQNKDAVIEFIYKDDYAKTLTSYAVNINYTFAEKMRNAGLNTLLGMGTVFIVLILLTLLISCFEFINKAQDKANDKKRAAEEAADTVRESAGTVAAAAPAVAQDDELAVVIAAAIAAYESERGVISPQDSGGYFVRSIRRRANNKWNKN
ncbi:MAG: OadG family protein [Lachnospiraceae bacterium]|nr:OadG family protein [Lachnospiraceae bacterium]